MRFSLVLLVTATTSIVLSVVLGMIFNRLGAPAITRMLFLVTTQGVAATVGFWAAMSGRLTLWRFVAVVALAVAFGWLASHWVMAALAIPMAVHATASAVPFFCLRLAGHTVSQATSVTEAPSSDVRPQWSLSTLFSVTTAIATLLGLFAAVRSFVDTDGLSQYWRGEGIAYVSQTGIVAFLTFWAMLSTEDISQKFAALGLFVLASCYACGIAFGTNFPNSVAMLFLPVLYCSAVGGVLRLNGIRLQRAARSGDEFVGRHDS